MFNRYLETGSNIEWNPSLTPLVLLISFQLPKELCTKDSCAMECLPIDVKCSNS